MPTPDPAIEALKQERGIVSDPAVEAMKRDRDAALRSGLVASEQRKPEQAARVLRLQGRLPSNPAPESVEIAEQDDRFSKIPLARIQGSESMRRFASDPDRAAAAIDDFDALADIADAMMNPPVRPKGSLLDVLSARTMRGRATMDLADAGYAALWDASPENLSRIQTRKEALATIEVPAGSTFAEWTGPAAEMLPLFFEELKSGAAYGAGGAVAMGGITLAAGQIGPQVALPEEIVTVPAAVSTGFFTGAKIGASVRVFQIEAGSTYADLLEMKDEAGNPIPEPALKGASVVVGAINAGLELVSLGALLKVIPGGKRLLGAGSKESARVAVREMLRNGGARRIFARIAKDYVASVAIESGTEVLQGVVEESAAQILDEAYGSGEREFDLAGPIQEGVEAFKATVVLGGIGGGARVVTETSRYVSQSRQFAARMAAVEQAAEKSKLRDRAPDTFRELANDLGQESGIEEVSIPAQALLDQAQASGVDLRELPAPIVEKIGEAAILGGDVQLSIGEWLTDFPEAIRKGLQEDIRQQADAMSVREADQAEKASQEALQGLAESESVEPESAIGEITAPEQTRVFRSAEDAGMSEEDFQRFEAARQEAWRAEVDRLQPQVRQEERRRSAAIRKAEREARAAEREARSRAQAEVETELSASPTWRLRAWIERGELTRVEDLEAVGQIDADKLDTNLLKERYPAKAGLIPRQLTRAGGLDPEIAAQLFGFESADAMVNALIDSRGTYRHAVRQNVDARMVEERGEPGSRVAEARQDAERDNPAQDDRLNFLLLEERALARRSGRSALTARSAREVARRLIAEKPIDQIRPSSYAATATRQALAAVEAARKGDYQAASDAKRRQILNLFLDLEARDARARVAKDVAAVRKLDQKAARDRLTAAKRGHLEQHDAVLESVAMRGSVAKLAREQTLERWIQEREAEGDEVIVPDEVRSRVAGASERKHWRQLTPTELADVRQSIENIAALARRWREVQTARETRLRDEVVADLQREAEEGILRKAQRSNRASAGVSDRTRAFLRGIDASLTQTEFLVDALGDSSPTSTWREAILNPLLDAQDAFNRKWREYGEKAADLMSAYDRRTQRRYNKILDEDRLLDTDGKPLELSRWNLIIIALNMGNASNLDKLIRGYGWNEQTVMEVLDTHLTKTDWEFVQKTWDTVEGLWPEIAAQEERLTGVAPPKVKAEPVSTRFGTYTGGYFPVVYDPSRSALGARNENFDIWSAQPGGFTRASTGHGHTIARTKVAAPILLERSVISKHLHDVILDLTHREAIANVSKLLADPRVDESLKANLGREFSYAKFWLPQLKAIAKNVANPGPIDIWNRVIRSVRLNASVFKLGFRASTLIMQTGGQLNGFRMLNEHLPGVSNTETAGYWARALYRGFDLFSGRTDSVQGVLEASEFMRSRTRSLDRDAREIMATNPITRTASDQVREFAMGLIARVQLYTVDIPTWIASRQAGIEKLGLSESESRRFADSMVRMSQGSGDIISQSSVMRGGPNGAEWMKAATLFYSYNNTVYNQLRRAGRMTSVRTVGSFMAAYAFYILGPAIYAESVRTLMRDLERGLTGEPEPDDDRSDESRVRERMAKIADVLVGETAQTVPLVRDMWGGMIAAMDPKQSFRGEPSTATAALIDEIRGTGRAIDSGDGIRMMIATMRGASFMAGLPGDWILRLADKSEKEANE